MKLGALRTDSPNAPAAFADVERMLMEDARPDFIRDAQAAIAFNQSTAAYVQQRVFERRYSEIRYDRLVPVNTEADAFAESVVYYSTENIGQAKMLSGGALDVPNVDVDATQHTIPVRMGGIGYSYTLEEQGQNSRSAVNLLLRKASAARLAAEKKIDSLVFTGDSSVNFKGLLNNSGITPANVAQNAGASSRLWANKTADEIIIDLNNGLSATYSDTLEVFTADTIILPPSGMTDITSKRMSADSDVSVADYFRRNNIYTQKTGNPLMIDTHPALETLGASTTRRMVTYLSDPEVLEFHLPMPPQFLPPHNRSALIIDVAGIFRVGGFEIRQPLAIKYRDGF